jgi:hypothetical protein
MTHTISSLLSLAETDEGKQQIVEPYFQAFADPRGTGTRYGPVHLFVKDSKAAICGTKSKRWNGEGETETDFCRRCLKEAIAFILTKQDAQS